MGRKYEVHRTMIGKVLKKSKIDWIKQNLPKRQLEFLRERLFSFIRINTYCNEWWELFWLERWHYPDPRTCWFYKKSVTSAGDVPEKVRFRTKAKYPEKLLVWITISEKGISEPFFIPKKASLIGSMREDLCKTSPCTVPWGAPCRWGLFFLARPN